MTVGEILSEWPVWVAVPAVMIIEFFRRLWKGDLVLGREFQRVEGELDKLSSEAARLAADQAATAKREREQLMSTIERLTTALERHITGEGSP